MPPKRTGSSDIFQTPKYALKPLIKYIPKNFIIWECACGNGNITQVLKDEGFKVIATDLKHGENFLTWQPDEFDCLVTNPPYSIKDEFLKRAYLLRKPFAFLLPITALEGRIRQGLYKEYGIEIILMNSRINFETPSGIGTGSWFASAWFTNGLDLGNQLTFETFREDELPLLELINVN